MHWGAAVPLGLSPFSLPPLPDASIFSLKEIQLQKDPGYRGSAFQQSGRTGEKPADPTWCHGCAGVDLSGSHIGKSLLLPALVHKSPLGHPGLSFTTVPKSHLCVLRHRSLLQD